MLYGLMNVSIFGVSFSQLSMGFTLFLFIVSSLTQIQEFLKHFNGLVKIAEFLVNMTYFLVAFGLLVLIVSFFGCVQTFLEELQRLVEIVLILELASDDLIYSNKLATNLLLDFLKCTTFNGSIQSRFETSFGVENIQYLFFTNTETHVSFGFSFDVLSFNTDVKAFLIEIGGSFIVHKLLELLSYSGVLLHTVLDLIIAVKLFGILKILTEGK